VIAIFGQLILWIALFCAAIQSILPLMGYFRHNPYLLAVARPAALGQFIAVLSAFFMLVYAFTVSDFSLTYVAANSHETLPLMYKLTAVWGAHEGSILLWIVLLNVWTLAFILIKNQHELFSLTLAILGLISFCFLLFLIFTSNPFVASSTPNLGQDLNPLLQDPGFVIHPPMLYMGYVGFSVAFAITQAALLQNQLNTNWAIITRQFTLAAWCFLTFGILLGSWWAYRVLGWGGFWFWDPVENASLLPWMAGIALIHVLLLTEKRDVAKNLAALLALTAFALSLLGTFLVRSGVLISAHTFAADPARGVFLLLLLAIVVTIALIVFMVRAQRTQTIIFPFASREMSLLLNCMLVMVALFTILLGTLYPLIADAFQLGAISVGAPYFNSIMLPIVLVIMLAMGWVPFTQWQTTLTKTALLNAGKKFIIALIMALILLWTSTHELNFIAIISLALACWIIISAFSSFRFAPGMTIAHSGFACLIIGILLSSTLTIEKNVRMQIGEGVMVGPYQFFLLGTTASQGENYRGIRATFDVLKGTRHVTTLQPEKRIYTVRDMVMTKVAIHPGIFRDLYLALGEPLDNDAWSVRLYYKPFIRFIWFGGLLMMLGGILAIREKYNKKRAHT
jgi:cytochrome c-type biogenesis protein CcmF